MKRKGKIEIRGKENEHEKKAKDIMLKKRQK